MLQTIKVAVIGGSGKAGNYLVKELLNRGFQVKALLRRPDVDPTIAARLQAVLQAQLEIGVLPVGAEPTAAL